MNTDVLNRSASQALFNFMPGQPFRWKDEVVIGAGARQVSALDVMEEWVAPALRRLIRPFAEATGGSELTVIDSGAFTLVSAGDLQATRFPDSYLCRTCQRFATCKLPQRPPACPGHGPMKQLAFAETHGCGHISSLSAPRCDRGCQAPMLLVNTSAFDTRRWAWKCSGCSTQLSRPVARWCPTCAGGQVRLGRVPTNEAFYTQHVTAINPPTRSTYAALSGPGVNAAAIAQRLGAVAAGVDALAKAGSGQGEDLDAKFALLADGLGWVPGDGEFEHQRDLFMARSQSGATPGWTDRVDALGLDADDVEALGEECRNLTLAYECQPVTPASLVDAYAGTGLEVTYQQYPSQFAAYGFEDVTLLRDLPVAHIVAGYTRGSKDAVAVSRAGQSNPTTFRFLETDPHTNVWRMYGVKLETEGLLFRLDPLAVVAWLVASNVVPDPQCADRDAARAWLFANVRVPKSVFSLNDESKVTAAVVTLTHSVAHRVLKVMGSRCGLNADSLAEFLFPCNAAFLLYANSMSDLTLGGIEHMFRTSLVDALNELTAEPRCTFDPVCREHSSGAACLACMYAAEISCARFNTGLDRNALFGSVPGARGTVWAPWWT